MFSLCQFVFAFSVIFLMGSIFGQQSYDSSNCTSTSKVEEPKYLCSSKDSGCENYIVYRAQNNFNTISSIASLFNRSIHDLLQLNNFPEDNSHRNLTLGREILIPVSCYCDGHFSQTIFWYRFSSNDTFSAVACGTFEGLVKVQNLIQDNPIFQGGDPFDQMINVSIRCACPDENQLGNGVNYLVTYPVMLGDHIDLIANKFGESERSIRDANNLGPQTTIFPETTLLIPTKNLSLANWEIGLSPESSPPLGYVVIGPSKASSNWKWRVVIGLTVFVAIAATIVACGASINVIRKYHPRSFQPSSARSSASPNMSPEFLDVMCKLRHTVVDYSLEELRIATEDFSPASRIGTAAYSGRIGESCLVIEQMDSEDSARQVTYILTRINHVNILKLEGWCDHGTNPYLVFELAENGSIRDCLSNPEKNRHMTWAIRMQIVLDLAVALHYLHYCTTPAFVHQNISSRTVLISSDWRAKISGFQLAKLVSCSEGEENINWNKCVIDVKEGYASPEYFHSSHESFKVDVYAFGVVLLELLSAKHVATDGKILKDPINSLVDEWLKGSSQSLETLKELVDPVLEGDYPLNNAICLVLLAKACIQENSHVRPTMNHVLKALSRLV